MDTHADHLPVLLRSLALASKAHPHERKLLVCESPAQGRELLRSLALSGVAWLGWEPLSPRQLALSIVGDTLAGEGLRTADAFDLMAVADVAIDEAEAAGGARPFLREVPAAYRDPMRRSVESLRAAGLTPAALRRARAGDARIGLLARVLERYEAGLRAGSLVDGPALLARSADALALPGQDGLAGSRVYLLPGLDAHGVAGRLYARLMGHGAQVLETDDTLGLEPPVGRVWAAAPEPVGALSWLHERERGGALAPDLDSHGLPGGLHLFAAATPADEVREVLRRVVAAGIPWDRVEIVATDADVYGNALDGLARRLGIPVTFSAGLDARRTRVGRVAEAYFRWLSDAFPAEVIRHLLETGDIAAPDGEADGEAGSEDAARATRPSGVALARRLRRLRIGWGYDRYMAALDRAWSAAESARPGAGDGDADAAVEALARERAELGALRTLLEPILSATPRLEDRQAVETTRTSSSALAGGLLALLERVPHGDAVEEAARLVLVERLERARSALTRETSWRAAATMLRARLRTRVAPGTEGGRLTSWTSAPGSVHLSDLAAGGLAARPHTFVVGLAAGAATAGAADPLLPDGDRAALGLPTTAERLTEGRHALAAVLARLRGEVTLSYAAWEMTEGRVIAPAPELLQALRLREGDPSLSYDDLRERLGGLACAVPADGALDGSDVWLGALAAPGGPHRDGTKAVRALHPGLDGGLRAAEARASASPTAWDGLVSPSPGLDPRTGDTVHSASRLETLGKCPLQYFYRYVLDARAVRDPAYDPEMWLDALERGSLLHTVYERTVAEAGRDADYTDPSLARSAVAVLHQEIRDTLRRLPAPSETVLRAETDALEADVLSFATMLLQQRPSVLWTELAFGPPGDAASRGEVEIAVPGGRLRLRGRVDRVDALEDGGLRVVDYKTGRGNRYRAQRPFDGGRRLQHLLYSLAVEQLEPDRRVKVMEYHFPTTAGENHVTLYPRAVLEPGLDVIAALLDLARDGRFLPTTDSGDCKYCDYAAACRVARDDWGGVTSPRAAWAKSAAESSPEYAPLVQLRAEHGAGR